MFLEFCQLELELSGHIIQRWLFYVVTSIHKFSNMHEIHRVPDDCFVSSYYITVVCLQVSKRK